MLDKDQSNKDNIQKKIKVLTKTVEKLNDRISSSSKKITKLSNNQEELVNQFNQDFEDFKESNKRDKNKLSSRIKSVGKKQQEITKNKLDKSDFNRQFYNFLQDYNDGVVDLEGKKEFSKAVDSSIQPIKNRIESLEDLLEQLSDQLNEDLEDHIKELRFNIYQDLYNLIIEKFSNIDFQNIKPSQRNKIKAQALLLNGRSVKEVSDQLDLSLRQIYNYRNALREDIPDQEK